MFGTTGIFFFNECYFVVSFLFAFKFYFFCLTNDPILLFLFGIEKEKKFVTVFFVSIIHLLLLPFLFGIGLQT